jgi:hypothetical protein
MNWLGKIFKRKQKTYNPDGTYKLLIINDEDEYLHNILGITQERSEELTLLCLKSFATTNHLHSYLEEIVSNCKHTNEIVYATLIAQRVMENHEAKERTMNVLKNMFGHG